MKYLKLLKENSVRWNLVGEDCIHSFIRHCKATCLLILERFTELLIIQTHVTLSRSPTKIVCISLALL